MKKLLALLLLASCSSTSTLSVDELQPLPTTGLRQTPAPIISINDDAESLERFVSNFYRNYTGFKAFTKAEIIEWGIYWCQLMQDGQKVKDIMREIRVYFSTSEQVDMMLAIFTNARFDLCPTNQ